MVDLSVDDLTAPPPVAAGGGNAFVAGLKSGGLGLAGSIEGAVGAGAQLAGFGNNNVFATAAKGFNQEAQAQGRPDLEAQGWTGGGIGGALSYGAYRAGQAIPQFAGLAAATAAAAPLIPEAVGAGVLGRLGMVAPKILGGAGGEVGAAAEATGAAFAKNAATGVIPLAATNAGDIYNDANARPGGATYGDAAKSIPLGAISGAVQTVGPHGAVGLVQSGLAHAGAFAIGSGLQEAFTSTNDPNLTAGERASNILQAAAGGAVFGGLIGVGGAAKGFLSGHTSTPDLQTAVDSQLDPKPVPSSEPTPGAPDPASAPGAPDPASAPVAAAPVAPDTAPSPIAPTTAPDLASLTATMAEARARGASTDLKTVAEKLGRPGPTEAPEAQLTPDQDAQLTAQMGGKLTGSDTLNNALAVARARGDTTTIDAIQKVQSTFEPAEIDDMRDPLALITNQDAPATDPAKDATLARDQARLTTMAPDAARARGLLPPDDTKPGDAPAPDPSTQDAARLDLFRQHGDTDNAIRSGTKMRDFIDNSKVTTAPELYASLQSELEDKTTLSRTPGFVKIAQNIGLLGDDRKPIDLGAERQAALENPNPQEREARMSQLDNIELLRDQADQHREPVQAQVIGPASASLQDVTNIPPTGRLQDLQGLTQEAGLRIHIPDTLRTPERVPETAPVAADATTAPADAAPAQGGTQPAPDNPDAPKSIADRIVDFAHTLLGNTGGEAKVADLRAAATRAGIAPSDFENGLRQIHADDSDNSLTQAPKGQRQGVDGVALPGAPGKYHNLSVDPRNPDAIQERGAAPEAIPDRPGGSPQDGSGNGPQGATPGAQPESVSPQVQAASGQGKAQSAVDRHAQFTREQDAYSAQAIRELRDEKTGAVALPPEAVGGTDGEAAASLTRQPEPIPARPDAPLLPRLVYPRSVDSYDAEDAARDRLHDSIEDDTPGQGEAFLSAMKIADNSPEKIPSAAVYAMTRSGIGLDDITRIVNSSDSDYYRNIADAIQKSGGTIDDFQDNLKQGKALQRTADLSVAKTMADIKNALEPDTRFDDALKAISDHIKATQPELEPDRDERTDRPHINPNYNDVAKQTLKGVLPAKASDALDGAWHSLMRDRQGTHDPEEAFALAKRGLNPTEIVDTLQTLGRATPEQGKALMSAVENKYGFTAADSAKDIEQGSKLLETQGETLGERIQRMMAQGLSHDDVGLPADRDLPRDPNRAAGAPDFSPKLYERSIYNANALTDAQKAIFKPVDFSKYDPNARGDKLPYPKYTGTNPLAGEIGARARSLGFNTDVRMFRGSERAPIGEGVLDPITKDRERGIFAADTHRVSNAYTRDIYNPSDRLGAVDPVPQSFMPMVARAKSAVEIEWRKINDNNANYDGQRMSDVLEHARAQGHDLVILRGIGDDVHNADPTKLGPTATEARTQTALDEDNRQLGTHTQYVVLAPEILRAQNAAFDPARLHENNLLARIEQSPDVTNVPPDRATVEKYFNDALAKANLNQETLSNVKLLNNASELPQSAKDAGRQSGVNFDRTDVKIPAVQHDGKVYVFADHISGPAEMQGLIAHEVLHAAIDKLTGKDVDNYTGLLSKTFDRAGGTDGLLKLADKFGMREEFERYLPDDGHTLSPIEKANLVNEMLALSAETNDKTFTSSQQANLAFQGRLKAGIATLMRKFGLGDFADRFMGFGVADVQKWLQDAKTVTTERQPPNTIDLSALPGSRMDMLIRPKAGERPLLPKLSSILDQNKMVEDISRVTGGLADRIKSTPIANLYRKLGKAAFAIYQTSDFVRGYGKQIPGIEQHYHFAEMGSQVVANLKQGAALPYRMLFQLAHNDVPLLQRFSGVVQDASMNRINPFEKWDAHTHLRDAPNRAELQALHTELHAEVNSWGQPVKSKIAGLFRSTDKNLEPGALTQLYKADQNQQQLSRNFQHINQLQSLSKAFFDGKIPGFETHAVQDYVNQRDIHENVQAARDYSRTSLNTLLDAADAHLQTSDADDAVVGHLKDAVDSIREELTDTDRGVPYTNFGHGGGDQFVAFTLKANENGTAAEPKSVSAIQSWLQANNMGDIGLNSTNTNRDAFIRFQNEQQRINFAKALSGELNEHLDLTKPDPIKQGNVATNSGVLPGILPALKALEDRISTKLSPETRATVLATIRGVYLDSLPQDSSLTQNVQRMNVQGQSKDILKNRLHADAVAFNSIGQGATMVDRANATASMEKQRNDMTSINHPLNSKVRQYSDAIDGYLARNAAQGTRVQSSFFGGLRNGAHAFYLAGSPGYLIMQGMQTYTLTMPELAKHFGYAQSLKAITGSSPDVGRVLAALASVQKDIVTAQLRGEPTTLTNGVTNEALRRYVAGGGTDAERARRQGISDFLGRLDSMGKLESGTLAHDNLASNQQNAALNIPRKAYQTLTATATYAELAGRLASGLASKSLYDSAPEKARGFSTPHDYAGHVISESMFDWGGASTSRLMSAGGPLGPLSPLVFQFHGFGTRLFLKIMQESYNGIVPHAPDRASFGSDADHAAALVDHQASVRESRRFILAHMAAVTTLAGSLGLPFAGWAAAAATKASTVIPGSNGEAYDVDAHYRDFLAGIFGNKLGEVFAHGLPRFINSDFSDLGDKDLLPAQSFLEDRRKLEDSVPDYLAKSWGSSIGAVVGVGIGVRDMSEGRMLPGLAHFLPTALRNVVNAYKIGTQGYQNSQGEAMNIPAGAVDVLKQALGMKNAAVQEEEEKSNTIMGAKDDRQYHSGIIKQQLARAIESGDQTGQEKWMTELQKYDTDPAHLGQPIGPTFQSYLENRQRAVQYSKATGLPLDAVLKDIATNAMVGGY